MRTVEKSRETDLASVGTVCNCLQLNRDAYYKTRVRLIEQKKTEEKVISLVKKERESQPRVGTMKLQKHLAHEFLKWMPYLNANRSALSTEMNEYFKRKYAK